MTYRDELDAAQSRADALQRRVDELEAAQTAKPEPVAARPSAVVQRTARRAAVLAIVLGAALGGVSLLVADRGVSATLLFAGVTCVPCAIGLVVMAHQHVQAGLDEAILVVGGSGGPRVLAPGTGRFLVPFIEQARRLDLRPGSVEAAIANVYTKAGEPVHVALTAQVRIRRTDEAIRRASERFLGAPDAIPTVAAQTLEGAARSVLAELDPEHARKDPARLADAIIDATQDDLDRLGLEVETLHASVT